MKLILNKNHIYMPAGSYTITDEATFEIQAKDVSSLSDFIITVSYNGNTITTDGIFKIPVRQLTSPYLEIVITLTNRSTGHISTYTSDKQALTRAVVLGLPTNEWYPSVVQSLLDRLAALEGSSEKNFNLVFEAVRELKNRGEVL